MQMKVIINWAIKCHKNYIKRQNMMKAVNLKEIAYQGFKKKSKNHNNYQIKTIIIMIIKVKIVKRINKMIRSYIKTELIKLIKIKLLITNRMFKIYFFIFNKYFHRNSN